MKHLLAGCGYFSTSMISNSTNPYALLPSHLLRHTGLCRLLVFPLARPSMLQMLEYLNLFISEYWWRMYVRKIHLYSYFSQWYPLSTSLLWLWPIVWLTLIWSRKVFIGYQTSAALFTITRILWDEWFLWHVGSIQRNIVEEMKGGTFSLCSMSAWVGHGLLFLFDWYDVCFFLNYIISSLFLITWRLAAIRRKYENEHLKSLK